MEKIIISLIVVILGLGNFCCYANEEEANIELNLKGETSILENEENYTVTVHLGEFATNSDNEIMGYEAVLDYDEEIFEKVVIKGLNGWTLNYNHNTKMLIGDTSSAKANTEITQMIFTLKENVQPTTTDITLNNMLLTDDQNDFEYNKKITLTIKGEDINKETNNTNKNSVVTTEKNTDISTAKSELPKAGIEIMILIGILIFIGIIWISGKGYISYVKDVKKQMKK